MVPAAVSHATVGIAASVAHSWYTCLMRDGPV